MPKRFALLICALCVSLPIAYQAARKVKNFRKPSTVSACPDWVLEQKQTSERVHPEKIVIEPFQGRHNVYGVFRLPPGYKPGSYFVVTIPGSSPYCGMIAPSSIEASIANDDQTFVGRFRTRTTLWLMTKGQVGELNHAKNWSLAIVKLPDATTKEPFTENWEQQSQIPPAPSSKPKRL